MTFDLICATGIMVVQNGFQCFLRRLEIVTERKDGICSAGFCVFYSFFSYCLIRVQPQPYLLDKQCDRSHWLVCFSLFYH